MTGRGPGLHDFRFLARISDWPFSLMYIQLLASLLMDLQHAQSSTGNSHMQTVLAKCL